MSGVGYRVPGKSIGFTGTRHLIPDTLPFMAEHFVNDGDGWACRRCRESEGAGGEAGGGASAELPRFFREGEAEEGGPRLAEGARARWKDGGRRTLVCPRCGAEEEVA